MMKKSHWPIILTLLFVVAGCQDNMQLTDNGKVPLPEGSAHYTLYTNAPPLAIPTTRIGSAQEESMAGGDFWVFVFDNTGTPASPSAIKLLEIVKAAPTSSTAPGPYKWITTLKMRNHPVKMILLANAPATVFDELGVSKGSISPSSFPENMTYSEALSKLHTSYIEPNAMQVTTSVPYTPNASIPMCAVMNFAQLDASTNLGSDALPLQLTRVVAKVTAENQTPTAEAGNALKPDFRIVGLNLHNATRYSALVPQATVPATITTIIKYEGAGSNPTTVIGPANDNTGRSTSANPIYLYESNETAAVKQPFVILECTYNSVKCYYKIALLTNHSPQIKRNTHYQILIKEATGIGYATYSEAVVAEPSNKIQWTMNAIDLSSHDIIDNGQYYLGVSNSEYILFSQLDYNDLEVLTLSHNAPSYVLPAQASIQVIGSGVTIINQPGLTVAPDEKSAVLTVCDGTTRQIPIHLKVTTGLTIDYPASLLVSVGNLKKWITIRRQPPIPASGGLFNYFAGEKTFSKEKEFVAGEIVAPCPPWICLSHTASFTNFSSLFGQGVLPINIVTTDNTASQLNREADAYFSRATYAGRVKARVTQSGF